MSNWISDNQQDYSSMPSSNGGGGPGGGSAIALFLAFVSVGIVMTVLFVFLGPMNVYFSSNLYVASDNMINSSLNPILANINNATIRNTINQTANDAQTAGSDIITIWSFLYKYGWILVVVIVVFTLFMLGLKTVELNKSGIA
jgi:predicted PurR-regulated permease PerM